MLTATTAPVPAAFARRPLRTLRPDDAADEYAHPRQQLARLERRGALHRIAPGYYVVVPQEYVGRDWRPSLEAAAAGIATADFGPRDVVLMGITAARLHRVIPRALAAAVVAVPRQRAAVDLWDRAATVRFVKRDTARLDVESVTTDLGRTLITTVEQTVLDLAHRPTLGDAEPEVAPAIRALYPRCSQDRLAELARAQRLRAALARATAVAG